MLLSRSLVLLGLCFLCGCGKGTPGLIPVTGVITLNSQPLAGARVLYFPRGATEGFGGEGMTASDGTYEITPLRNCQGRGLPPGAYKVVVSRQRMPDGSLPSPDVPPLYSGASETVPASYSSLRDTSLAAIVFSASQTHNFRLASAR